jgi:hypothetical protein
MCWPGQVCEPRMRSHCADALLVRKIGFLNCSEQGAEQGATWHATNLLAPILFRSSCGCFPVAVFDPYIGEI